MTTKSFNRPVGAAGDAGPDGSAGGRSIAVMCAMLSRGQGGLEQSLLDYAEALSGAGEQVAALVHPEWPGRAQLERLGIEAATFRSLGEWDPLAAARLRRLISTRAPDVVLTIGRRASTLARKALARLPRPPHVAVTPNYSLAHLVGLDHVIATTGDLERALIAAGHPEARISIVPNMIRMPEPPGASAGERGREPVIGALGRFVANKGFADLIDALALLRAQGRDFRARLGGDGREAAALRAKIAGHGLEDRVELAGWVDGKARFFEEIDVFSVPSRHEPFGIVVLEGLAHGRATVVTDAEGPREIVTDGIDGLIVPRGDPAAMAAALGRLLDQPDLRARLAGAGRTMVGERYALPVVARRISAVLRELANPHEAAAHGEPTRGVSP